jgi:hypothetical protein
MSLLRLRALWRAAMRGRKEPTMADDMLYQLLAEVPPKATQAIVIFPEDGVLRCRWIGFTAEETALALYEMGDTVVDQRVPLREHIKPPR